MGNLRARSDDEKMRKRKAILDAAWHLLKQADGQLPTAIEIAKHANVSKGTVYVYFKTKEEIFIELFLNRLKQWITEADRILASIPNPDIVSISRALAQYPIKTPLLLVLGTMLHGVLEKNAPFQALLDMKLQVAQLMMARGQLLNTYLPWLPPQQGAKSMLTIYALFTSLYQSWASSPMLKKELKKRGIDIFEVDLETDMVNAAVVLFTGLQTLLEG